MLQGLATVEDGVTVEVVYFPHVSTAVARLGELEVVRDLTPDALEVLVIVATLGEATRRQIEGRRLQDSASLLDRLVRRGLLAKRSEEDQLGQPNAYRLTTRALGRLGHATLESLQAWCQEQLQAHVAAGRPVAECWAPFAAIPLPPDGVPGLSASDSEHR